MILLHTRHALPLPADHFESPLRRIPARPDYDQHARDDRAIRLNLKPGRTLAQLMPTAQNVLEHAEALLDSPSISKNIGDKRRGHVQHVGCNSQNPVTGGPRRFPLLTAPPGVRFRFDQNHANLVIRPFGGFAAQANIDDEISRTLFRQRLR